MTTKTNYLSIIPVKCDCCGEMVEHFSDRSQWWGKYLKPGEEKICNNCIKDRPGYREEFKEIFGLDFRDDPPELEVYGDEPPPNYGDEPPPNYGD